MICNLVSFSLNKTTAETDVSIKPPPFTIGKKTAASRTPERNKLNLLFSAAKIPLRSIKLIGMNPMTEEDEVPFSSTLLFLNTNANMLEIRNEKANEIIRKESSSSLYVDV